MATTDQKGAVLVTGGPGFLAKWTILELLRRGYAVRATLRAASREVSIRATIGPHLQ